MKPKDVEGQNEIQLNENRKISFYKSYVTLYRDFSIIISFSHQTHLRTTLFS